MLLTIDPFLISPNSGYTHSATSWEFSKAVDFTNPANILFQSLNDITNLLELTSNIVYSGQIFCRVKIHLSNGESTEWSKIALVKKEVENIKYNKIIILTPKVNAVVTKLLYGERSTVEITATAFTLFNGPAVHSSTSWTIETLDGDIVYKRLKDETNLTTLSTTVNMDLTDKIYLIKAVYHTNVNTSSNPGIFLYTANIKDTHVNLLYNNVLYSNKLNLFQVETNLTGVITLVYELIAQDASGTVLIASTATTIDSFFIDGSILDINLYYTLRVTVKVDANYTIDLDPINLEVVEYVEPSCTLLTTKVYDDLVTTANLVELFGEVSFTTEELNGDILLFTRKYLGDPTTGNIYRYRYNDITNELFFYDSIAPFDFTVSDELRHSTIIPMDNMVYVDVSPAVVDTPRIRKVLNYNKYTRVFELQSTPTMTATKDLDVVLTGNISAKLSPTEIVTITKDAGGVLYLNILNVVSSTIVSTTAMPVGITLPSISNLCDGKIFILDNSDYSVHIFNSLDLSFTPETVSAAALAYFTTGTKTFDVILREDKKVLLTVNNGGDAKDQFTVTYDYTLVGTDPAWAIQNNPIVDKKFTATIKLSTGDLLKIATDGSVIKYT